MLLRVRESMSVLHSTENVLDRAGGGLQPCGRAASKSSEPGPEVGTAVPPCPVSGMGGHVLSAMFLGNRRGLSRHPLLGDVLPSCASSMPNLLGFQWRAIAVPKFPRGWFHCSPRNKNEAVWAGKRRKVGRRTQESHCGRGLLTNSRFGIRRGFAIMTAPGLMV